MPHLTPAQTREAKIRLLADLETKEHRRVEQQVNGGLFPIVEFDNGRVVAFHTLEDENWAFIREWNSLGECVEYYRRSEAEFALLDPSEPVIWIVGNYESIHHLESKASAAIIQVL